MTTTATPSAETIAAEIQDCELIARRTYNATRQAIQDARANLYQLEAAEKTAEAGAVAAAAELRALLRALAHRDDGLTIETEHGRTLYRATFGTTGAYLEASTPGWSSKPKPQRARAWIRAHTDDRSRELYQSPRGTSDPDRQTAELAAAQDAAEAAALELTAAAYLRARGIDPDTAPAPTALLAVIPGARTAWYGAERWYEPTWTLALAARPSEQLADAPTINGTSRLAEARADAAAGGPNRATLEQRNAARYAIPTFPTLEAAGAYATEHAAEALALLARDL